MERAEGVFTVKEGAPSVSGADDAPVRLVFEADSPGLPSLAGRELIFDCEVGVTYDEARELANALRAKVRQVRIE
jgi:hypothetical protein